MKALYPNGGRERGRSPFSLGWTRPRFAFRGVSDRWPVRWPIAARCTPLHFVALQRSSVERRAAGLVAGAAGPGPRPRCRAGAQGWGWPGCQSRRRRAAARSSCRAQLNCQRLGGVNRLTLSTGWRRQRIDELASRPDDQDSSPAAATQEIPRASQLVRSPRRTAAPDYAFCLI